MVPHNYGLVLYENKLVRDITLSPTSTGDSSKGGHPITAVVWPCSPLSVTIFFLLRPMSGTYRPACWSTALATRSSPL